MPQSISWGAYSRHASQAKSICHQTFHVVIANAKNIIPGRGLMAAMALARLKLRE